MSVKSIFKRKSKNQSEKPLENRRRLIEKKQSTDSFLNFQILFRNRSYSNDSSLSQATELSKRYVSSNIPYEAASTNKDNLLTKPTGLFNLRVLEIGWTNVNDESLEYVLQFQKLRKLNIAGCQRLTTNGLRVLASTEGYKLAFLTDLSAGCNRNIRQDLSFLTELSNLQVLDLRQVHALTQIPCLKRLISLNLSNSGASASCLTIIISECLCLKSLDVSLCDLSQPVLVAISAKLTLSDLDVGDSVANHRSRPDYSVLKSLTNLKRLVLLNNIIRSEQVSALLQTLTGLEILNMDGRDFSPRCFRYLHNLSNLRILDAFDAKLGGRPEDMQYILPLAETLTNLSIGSGTLDDNDLEVLARLVRIRFLNISRNTRVTNVGLNFVIGGLKMLQSLNISNTSISQAGVIKLIALEELEYLNVRNLNVQDDTVTILLVHLPKLWHVMN